MGEEVRNIRDLIQVGTVEAVDGIRVSVRFKGKKNTDVLTCLDCVSVPGNGERYTGYTSGGSGYAEFAEHRHKIPRWIPPVGARVVCLMLPDGQGQGFVIGAI